LNYGPIIASFHGALDKHYQARFYQDSPPQSIHCVARPINPPTCAS